MSRLTITLKTFVRLGLSILCALSFPVAAQGSPELCYKAVDATKRYVTSNKKISEARFKAKKISHAQYTNMVNDLNTIETEISMDQCMKSDAEALQIFRCLATNGGNYTFCSADKS
ncbi:MAG: hypothetical protein K6L80_03385 [Agarilytica sp.]